VLVVDEIATAAGRQRKQRGERGSMIHHQQPRHKQWGEILGDAVAAAALIDRLGHHATMIGLKGKSYRMRERAPASCTPPRFRSVPPRVGPLYRLTKISGPFGPAAGPRLGYISWQRRGPAGRVQHSSVPAPGALLRAR